LGLDVIVTVVAVGTGGVGESRVLVAVAIAVGVEYTDISGFQRTSREHRLVGVHV